MFTSTRDPARLATIHALAYGPLLSDSAVVSASGQAELAAAYAAMPDRDPDALPAWEAMASEVWAQYRELAAAGLRFGVVDTDPYATPRDMFADVDSGRILCMSTATTGGHAYWDDATNDAFRAVHDVLGHYAAGRGFDRHGEEAAYRRHALTFSPVAAMAMATETRGQNAQVVATGEFGPEKLAILPAPFRDPYALTPADPTEYRTANRAAASYHAERVA